MRLLLIEDEAKLASYLRQGLSEEGFVVETASNGVDGLHMATQGHYDLIVLDGMLPGIDGLGVLAALRHSRDTPVLMLTARDGVRDRVRGLDLGSDDYLVKPFSLVELLARIRALIRRSAGNASSVIDLGDVTVDMAKRIILQNRMPVELTAREYALVEMLSLRRGKTGGASEPTVLRLHDLELDLLKRRATRAGKRLDLSAKEFNLLALFLRRPGEVLSRTEIAEQVWDMNFDSNTNVVEVAIRRLRSKLDEPFEVNLLHTVRGMGYVMELSLIHI